MLDVLLFLWVKYMSHIYKLAFGADSKTAYSLKYFAGHYCNTNDCTCHLTFACGL